VFGLVSALGFSGPSELESGVIQTLMITLLNEAATTTGGSFYPLR
jgi:hypothetical protein